MLNPDAGGSETTTPVSFQPMGFTDILDTTFSFYRDHFRLLIGISAFYAFWHLCHRSVFFIFHILADRLVSSRCGGFILRLARVC